MSSLREIDPDDECSACGHAFRWHNLSTGKCHMADGAYPPGKAMQCWCTGFEEKA